MDADSDDAGILLNISLDDRKNTNLSSKETVEIHPVNESLKFAVSASRKNEKTRFLAKARSHSSRQIQDKPTTVFEAACTSKKNIRGQKLATSKSSLENSDSIEDNDVNLNVDELKKSRNTFIGRNALGKDGNKDSKVHDQQKMHISSLFKSNPEIPHIGLMTFKKRKEVLFSKKLFEELNLHPHLVSCLQSRFGISTLTEVQESAIPVLLEKKDALVKSCTGSGKTLAYSVPIVQQLQETVPKIQRSDGVYALVIVPTRELALQSFECFSTLTKAFTWIVPGYLVGGEKKKSEKARIRKGINILISTPGRLLDHLESTTNLDLKYITWLIIDEADKLLEQGYEESMMKILSYANQSSSSQRRQSVLLSATLSKGVEELAGMSLADPVFIDIAPSNGVALTVNELVIPSQLQQYVIVTPTKLRLVTLSAFVIDKCASGNLKALIFFATQKEVDFHYNVFCTVLKNVMSMKDYKCKFSKLHGSMAQEERFKVFDAFKADKSGLLFCTDVAARGLDLPSVDWIIQYSVPSTLENYVHRVGRTARIGKEGHSLLFLIPSEVKYVDMLQEHNIQLEEMEMKDVLVSLLLICDVIQQDSKQHWRSKTLEEHATALQMEYENLVYSDPSFYESAKDAFMTYVQAYSSYPKAMRIAIPFKKLHLGHVAKSFCLREAPSALGCRFASHSRSFRNSQSEYFKPGQSQFAKPTRYKRDSKGMPRQQREESMQRKSIMVSEFGSGFDELKIARVVSLKKRKF